MIAILPGSLVRAVPAKNLLPRKGAPLAFSSPGWRDSGPSFCLIHPTAWKGDSPKFSGSQLNAVTLLK
jgi:hypothetical protein